MSDFSSIDLELLVGVTGGAVKASGEVTTPTISGKGSIETNPDPVKVYGEGNLLACKQQASDNFGHWYQSSKRLDSQLADCDRQFGAH